MAKGMMSKKIKEDQAKKILEERNHALHANILGSHDIDVPRGRHTTLIFYLNMGKRWRGGSTT